MSMNLIAILITFAMMLTGVGGEGQPAEASRMLMIHNVSVTYNDETVDLDPALWLGAYSNGEKAVFDFGVQMDGDTLFPMQLGADESGITALFVQSDVAAKVSADALNGLAEQMSGMLEAAQSQMAEGENADLMNFIMNEYLPAYTGMLEAVQDPEYLKQMQQKANAAALGIIDRGEGTPVTETYDDQEYALTEYHYTVESDQMAELIDAIYASDEKLAAYYDTMFKLYDMMPEESGLKGITSFKDMFEKTGLQMTMDITEKVSDDEEVDMSEATITVDMNAMIQKMVAAQAEETASEDQTEEAASEDQTDETASSDVPGMPPMEIYVIGNKIGAHQDAYASFSYEVNDAAMDMTVNASSEGEDDAHMLMSMSVAQESEEVGSFIMSMDQYTDEETGDKNTTLNMGFSAADNDVGFTVYGAQKPDGDQTYTVVLGVNTDGAQFALSFDVDVTSGEIGDLANGHEAAVTLDDLSQEAMDALGENQEFQAAMMQAMGSLMADSQKLTANESVQKLVALFASMNSQSAEVVPEEDEYEDDTFEGEELEDYEYEYEEPEDDGELGYNEPEFTWLPEGWQVLETEVDTQYDWVNITAGTDDYSNTLYATFYQDNDENTVNYVVGGDGEIEAVDGREMSVSDFGDGSMSVSVHENGLYGNLMFFSGEIDVETIGHIVAGIQF